MTSATSAYPSLRSSKIDELALWEIDEKERSLAALTKD